MSREIVELPPMEQMLERYRQLSDEALLSEFQLGMQEEASGLFRKAAVLRVWEEKGRDLEEIKQLCRASFDVLRCFAQGKLIPQMSKFWPDDLVLLKTVSSLVTPDQIRVASDERFVVLELAPNNEIVRYERTAARMTSKQLQLVFGGGSIRNEHEQQDILMSRRTRVLRLKPPEKIGPGAMDYVRIGVDVPRGFLALSVLEEMVRALRRFGHK